MRIKKKSITAWAAVLMMSAIVIYGCRSLPPEPPLPITEEALPEKPHEVQPPEDAVAMTHDIAGFEDCTGCHYEGGADAGATIVDQQHYCSACHEMAQAIPFDHGESPNVSCTLCHRPE